MEFHPRDVADLQRCVEAGWTPQFVFFWGHTSSSSVVGKECLSQWYPARFVVDGDDYATAEHYMMTQKALLFGDAHAAAQIRACDHPGDVKELGRHVRDFDHDRWEEKRFDIVAAGSLAKFSQNPSLQAFLLGTDARVLVEASPKDTIWGIGLAENDPRARDVARWRGLNLLGFALMHARSAIARA